MLTAYHRELRDTGKPNPMWLNHQKNTQTKTIDSYGCDCYFLYSLLLYQYSFFATSYWRFLISHFRLWCYFLFFVHETNQNITMPGLIQQLSKQTIFRRLIFLSFGYGIFLLCPLWAIRMTLFGSWIFLRCGQSGFLNDFLYFQDEILFRSKGCISFAAILARPHSLLLTFSPLSGTLFSLIPSPWWETTKILPGYSYFEAWSFRFTSETSTL